jgi:hypothetical protein
VLGPSKGGNPFEESRSEKLLSSTTAARLMEMGKVKDAAMVLLLI